MRDDTHHSTPRHTALAACAIALSTLACVGPCFLSEPGLGDGDLDVSIDVVTQGPGEIGQVMVLGSHQVVQIQATNRNGAPFDYAISEVSSSDPGVLSVERLSEDTFRMDALAEGVAELTVTGLASHDEFGSTELRLESERVRVEVPTSTTLSDPSCVPGGAGVFLADTSLTIGYTFFDASGRPMQGVASPFDLDAIAPFGLNGFDGFEIDLSAPQDAGEYTLGARHGGWEVTVRTVDAAAIDGVTPTAEDGVVFVRLFGSDPVLVALTAQGDTICGVGDLSYALATVDHDQCRSRTAGFVPFVRLPTGELGAELDVNIRRQGTCELDLTVSTIEEPFRVAFEVRITD